MMIVLCSFVCHCVVGGLGYGCLAGISGRNRSSEEEETLSVLFN